MSVHEGAFPRKPRYYNIKIESFDNIGMINSEDIQIKENEIIAKIKELIRTETQRQRENKKTPTIMGVFLNLLINQNL